MQKKSEKFTKSNRPMSSCGPTKPGPIRYYSNLYILPPDEPRVLLLSPLSTRLARPAAAAVVAAVTVTCNQRKVRAL